MSDVIILRADRWLDVTVGEVRSPAVIVVDGNQIVGVNPAELPTTATEIDLGDVTLLPGLMDMELNMLIGGPGGPDGLPDPMHGVKDSPVYRTLRGAVNCNTTLMAGFTTVRNLGLMVYTAGFLLDVDLARAVDQGWFPGPRIFPAGHAITPTGGHLDPTMFQGLAPGIMPQSVESGIANGISEVRKSVRYQMKYGAKLIRISASGGVMSFSSAAGAQQYSDEELAASSTSTPQRTKPGGRPLPRLSPRPERGPGAAISRRRVRAPGERRLWPRLHRPGGRGPLGSVVAQLLSVLRGQARALAGSF